MKKSVLVVFGKEDAPLDLKGKYEEVISGEKLKFFIDSGSVEKAAELTRSLSLIKTKDGKKLPSIFKYEGYELWWIHYDDLMYKFCLPFTQYERLLNYLASYQEVHLYKPPFPNLFRIFLRSHGVIFEIEEKFERSLPLGIILQTALSVPFLLWAKMRRAKLMVWASDSFDPPRDHDFRLRFIYEELRKRRLGFIEFIRSMESSRTVISHALKRRRPVIYSFAIVKLISYFSGLYVRNEGRFDNLIPLKQNPMGQFWYLASVHYLRNVSGDIYSIKVLKFILKFLGVKVSIIASASSRSFHEVLASKLCGIETIGILHGAASKDYNVYDFMPEFKGSKTLSLDKYGVWSEWWKEYYLKYSKVYKSEQLYVSGPMRPLSTDIKSIYTPPSSDTPIKVLFVSEQLAVPSEVMPYLLALLAGKHLEVYLTFRPYRDGFEDWLKANHPEIITRFDSSKIIRSGINDAIAKCDVVVGSHSTAVLESLLQLKPFIFFHTNKWGDYYSLKLRSEYPIFASSPEDLVGKVSKSGEMGLDTVKILLRDFFGNPHMNGSSWVVDEAEKKLG